MYANRRIVGFDGRVVVLVDAICKRAKPGLTEQTHVRSCYGGLAFLGACNVQSRVWSSFYLASVRMYLCRRWEVTRGQDRVFPESHSP